MSSGLSVSAVDFVPVPRPSKIEPVHVNAAHRSDGLVSAASHRMRSGAEHWRVDMIWDAIGSDAARGILAKLERWGTVETFRIFIPGEENAHGDATETELDGLLVDGSDQSGRTLNVRTDPVVASMLMVSAGDFIGWVADGKHQMVRLNTDIVTAADGTASVEISQFIRTSPDDGTPIFTSYIPLRVSMLEDPGYQIVPEITYGFRLKLKEEPLAT